MEIMIVDDEPQVAEVLAASLKAAGPLGRRSPAPRPRGLHWLSALARKPG
jgi:hypothetical protein